MVNNSILKAPRDFEDIFGNLLEWRERGIEVGKAFERLFEFRQGFWEVDNLKHFPNLKHLSNLKAYLPRCLPFPTPISNLKLTFNPTP
jgi:hypothetical protein